MAQPTSKRLVTEGSLTEGPAAGILSATFVAQTTLADLRSQTGVEGDGTTDDTAAINAAISGAAALGVRLIANGTFRINSTVTITGDVDLGDATFNYYGTGTAVVVGSTTSSDEVLRKTIVLPRIINAAKVGTGWAAGTIGVKAANLYSCFVTIPHVRGFETGLQVTGIGTGNVYNEFHVGHLENNKRNLHLTADATGWSNQNLYLGGRYSHESGEGTAVTGARQILIDATPNGINNNTWINPSLEGGVAEQVIDFDGGSYNIFINPRLEHPTGAPIRFGATSGLNRIIGGYKASDAVITRVSGELKNTIQAGQLFEVYGSSGDGLMRLTNTTGNASPALAIAPTADFTAWAWRHSVNDIQGKRSTDAVPRVIVDAVNGRVYAGNGTTAATAYIGNVGASSLGTNASFLPSVTATLSLGSTSQRWMQVYISQALNLADSGALPSALVARRGEVRMVFGAAGVADQIYVCRKNAADAYEWVPLA